MQSPDLLLKKLLSLRLSHDIPVLETSSTSLNYVTDFDSNFEDNAAYSVGMNRFIEEASDIKKLNEFVNEGRKTHSPMFYTWRSISRTLPSINDDTPNKNEIYETSLAILKPQIEEVFKAYNFSVTAREQLVSQITKLSSPERAKESLSHGLSHVVCQMLDMLNSLDCIRSAKTSVKNDLAYYKRLLALTKQGNPNPTETQLLASVSIFLATNSEILDSLKKSISQIDGSTNVMCEIISYAADYVECKYYMTPEERHQFIRALTTALILVADEKGIASKLDQKKVPLSRLDRVVRDTPAVNLMGDMSFNMIVSFRRMTHLYEWSILDPSFISKLTLTHFNAISSAEQFGDEHSSFLSEFTIFINCYTSNKSLDQLYDFSPEDAAVFYTMGLKALKLLSKWNYTLQEIVIYKMGHPADKFTVPDLPEDVDEYALATKYNYSAMEKSAIARIIFYIKSLYGILKEHETLLTCASNSHIYNALQSLVYPVLKNVERKSQKSKNILFKTLIAGILLIASDYANVVEDSKSKKANVTYSFKSKSVAPLSSQIYMIKTMLQFIASSKDLKKELDQSSSSTILNFIDQSIFHHHMANFPSTFPSCSILGNFWFKEFYLEISAGKHIQFPIDWSFIWIIVQHLLDFSEPDHVDYMLYAMDLYNDAAQSVLELYKRRFLFDEIDAEVVLCFEQLTYFLSDRMYIYFKSLASSIIIDKSMKNEIVKKVLTGERTPSNEITLNYQSAMRFINISRQRSIQYLGRALDINHLLAQRFLINLKHSIHAAITWFEAGKIESVLVFKCLIDATDMTHQLISECFALPPFSQIFNEVNNSICGGFPRINAQFALLLISDVAPNYSYNTITNRYVRSPIFYEDQLPEESPPKIPLQHMFGTRGLTNAFIEYHSVYTGYLGPPHFDAIISLIGYSGVAFLIDEITKYITSKVKTTMADYVRVLLEGMPQKCALPRTSYGFNGVIEYYNAQLEAILKYNDMRNGVLHSFREFGNFITIVLNLQQAMFRTEAFSLFISAPFAGVLASSDPSVSGDSKNIADLSEKLKYCMIMHPSILAENKKIGNAIERASLLTHEKLCCGLSFFEGFILSLGSILTDDIWKSREPPNGVVTLEECSEFNRLFSAICYYMTNPPKDVAFSNDELFGHGVYFCGLTIIILLKQQHRFSAQDFVTHALFVSEVDPTGSQSVSSINTGTIRQTATFRTIKKEKEPKIECGEALNKKILMNMKIQLARRRLILNILNNAFNHVNTSEVVVKCFHPPAYIP